MLGSQALETAIGLVLMFLLLALTTSSLVEVLSRAVSKRAKDLEKVLWEMLRPDADSQNAGPDSQGWKDFQNTSIYTAARRAAGQKLLDAVGLRADDRVSNGAAWKKPSYISAKAFADAVLEMANTASGPDFSKLPKPVRDRVTTLQHEAQDDVLVLKAGLERWFDDTMGRLEGAYKRWAMSILFVFSLVIAVGANASTYHVARDLWTDPATREAVASAAADVVDDGDPADLATIATTTDDLAELGLPVGWHESARDSWSGFDRWGDKATYVAGWLLTSVLVMLGAPFWFDLLTKLVALRGAGTKPDPAAEDRGSASFAVAARKD